MADHPFVHEDFHLLEIGVYQPVKTSFSQVIPVYEDKPFPVRTYHDMVDHMEAIVEDRFCIQPDNIFKAMYQNRFSGVKIDPEYPVV